MALMLNTVNVAGNLTRNPEVKFLSNETALATFGIAINRKYRGGDGEMKEETTFVEVECWKRQAELVGQYLTKGRNCLIEGSLKLDQWEDKAGKKQSRLKILAQRVHFLGGAQDRPVTGEDDHEKAGIEPRQPSGEPIDDEPPF